MNVWKRKRVRMYLPDLPADLYARLKGKNMSLEEFVQKVKRHGK